MSNLLKNSRVSCDDGTGIYYLKNGNPANDNELAAAVTGAQQVGEDLTDAEMVLKQTIIKSRQILENAQADAENLVKNAREQGFENGYEEGFGQGSSQGREISLKERQPLTEAISQFSQRLSEYYAKPSDKYEYFDSAFEIAEKIIKSELEENDEAYFGLFKKAAEHISNVGEATLKTGERGRKLVQADKRKYENAVEGLSELKVELAGDGDGLCILETSLGNIDVSADVQLKRAKRIVSPQGGFREIDKTSK